MEAVWFAIVSGMLAMYAALDGFDFGVGIVHRIVARTDAERRVTLAAIGPIWDGNEVWLIAAGGVLFMAFPSVYATAFSGFYLALNIVLWLLILRGVAIEYRSHEENPLWREFCDTVFSIASAMLAVVFGAALGNLIRGVPLGKDGLRGMALFTNFLPGREPGILDWYTVLVALLTLVALAAHGALYLAWRTDGLVRARSLALARPAWIATIALWAAATAATAWVQPAVFANLASRPWNLAFVAPLDRRGVWRLRVPAARPRARGVPVVVDVRLWPGGDDTGGQLPQLAEVNRRPQFQPDGRQFRVVQSRARHSPAVVGRGNRPGRSVFHEPVPHDTEEGRGRGRARPPG